MKKILLYFHTLRYLKFQQIYYRIYYALRSRWRKKISHQNIQRDIPNEYQLLTLAPSLYADAAVFTDGEIFKFLNLSKTFNDGIDWNFVGHKKLWTYNLTYFEYLHQKDFSKELGLILINDFIDKTDIIKDGFEPYPISLRVIHWIKFLTYYKIKNRKIDKSLYIQLWKLVDSREFHLLGNHLLENGFGLLFGAYYFNDNKLFKYATSILIKELEEQILDDGGHFELSPTYHQLMLYRVLDCYNLVKHNILFNQSLQTLLETKASVMLGWLNQMTFSNGDVPLLNDSAFKINPTTKELNKYASQLNIVEHKKILKGSGYRKITKDNYEIVVDIGKIGPNYIPGHAHSDIFNFVLHVKGKPFIVDTGISTYNPTKRRQIERSTGSHNTVQIDNYEQTEIWSSFRVARRTYPKVIMDSSSKIKATLNYATTKSTHIRTFEFLDNAILIQDKVDKNEKSKAYLHFHPSVTNIQLKDGIVETNKGNIIINDAFDIKLENFEYAPQFNILKKSQRVVIVFFNKIETTINIL